MNAKTYGVVIKRSNFGEADKILTILTERFGKIKVIAKGVRKIKSKLAGSLEPFMVLNLNLHEGKTFYTVTGAVIEEEFQSIHTDLEKTSQAFYLGEIADKFLPEHQKLEESYSLFCEALRYLNNNQNKLLVRFFEFKILEVAGFHPEVYCCVHCRKKLIDEENFWDNQEGGVICNDCQKTFRHGAEITNDAIKILRLILEKDFSASSKVSLSKELESEVESVIQKYIDSVLEKPLNSREFMNEVVLR